MSERYRYALVWNYEDDNFTYRDVAAVIGDAGAGYSLAPGVCMQYGFQPGWATRWVDAQAGQIADETWTEAGLLGKRWLDYFGPGESEDILFLTLREGVWLDDQFVDNFTNAKEYFVERIHIDLDDLVTEWTTNYVKHLREFVFHMLTPDFPDDPPVVTNSFDFYIGWSLNLMAAPRYQAAVRVPLTEAGDYKVDFRSTGRYLAWTMDFKATQRIVMTGGDLDAEQAHGR